MSSSLGLESGNVSSVEQPEREIKTGREESATSAPLQPVIHELKEIIEGDPKLFRLFHDMFTQVPDTPPYKFMPGTDYPQVGYAFNPQLRLTRDSRSKTTKPC